MSVKDSQFPAAAEFDGSEKVAILQGSPLANVLASIGSAAKLNAGGAGGVAVLDSSGKLSSDVMPPLAIVQVFPVDSEAAMLALDAQRGDVAIRSDLNDGAGAAFILTTDDPTVLVNWVELPGSQGIFSVNGKTGPSVTLAASDVGAATTAQGAKADAALPAASVGAAAGAASLNGDVMSPATERRRKKVDLGVLSADTTIDLSAGDIFVLTLGANITLSFENLPPANYTADIELRITQDDSTVYTLTISGSGKFPGADSYAGPATVSQVDFLGVEVGSDGSWTGYPVEDM